MMTPASVFFSVARSTQNLGRRLSEMSEKKSSDVTHEDVQVSVRDWIIEIAGQRGMSEDRASIWRRVARACAPISASRISDLFYREARRIDAVEYLKIKEAAERAKALRDKKVTATPAGTH